MAHQPANLAILQTAAQHGLLILPGQEQNFLDLEISFHHSLKPAAGIETYLFYDALRSWWNVHRCHMAESQIYRSQNDPTLDPLLDDSHESKYKRIRHLERSSRLAFHKPIQKLGDIQTEARYRLQAFPPQEGIDIHDQMPHNLSVLTSTDKVLNGALKTGKTAIVTKTSVTDALEFLTSQLNSPATRNLEPGATEPPRLDLEALKLSFLAKVFAVN